MSSATLTVHKFDVTPGPFVLKLSRRARILDVQMQVGEPKVWVLLDPDDFTVERKFYCVGTGHTIEGATVDDVRYIGTFQMNDGALVWHLFECKP